MSYVAAVSHPICRIDASFVRQHGMHAEGRMNLVGLLNTEYKLRHAAFCYKLRTLSTYIVNLHARMTRRRISHTRVNPVV